MFTPKILLLGLTCGSAEKLPLTLSNDFDAFIDKHGRDYQRGTSEYAMRSVMFAQRLAEVQQQNAQPNRAWTAGINHLADRTEAEFQSLLGWRHHGGRAQQHRSSRGAVSFLQVSRQVWSEPERIDWRNLSTAAKVPDQGGCGSCWAEATSGLLEAHYEITNKVERSFSAQELVDCVQNPRTCGGEGGCKGATVELGLDWALHRGLSTATETPYNAAEGTCLKDTFRNKLADAGSLDPDGRIISFPELQEDSKKLLAVGGKYEKHAFGLRSFTTLPTNKYMPLVRALVDQGPVAVSVAADMWMLYSSGVFDSCPQGATINHAVLLYGFGTSETNRDYWLIRNSWGKQFGEQGYIRIAKRADEEAYCGRDHDPLQGISCVSKDTPKSVTVCGTCGILYDSVVPHMEPHEPTSH
jgi:cathepsin L